MVLYLHDVTFFFLIVKTDKHRKYLLCDAKKRQNYYGHCLQWGEKYTRWKM